MNNDIYEHLMTGVSLVFPLVAARGLCITLSSVFGIEAFKEPGPLASSLIEIGATAAFVLMAPVLAGYISVSIAARFGLAPGFNDGRLASLDGAGFFASRHHLFCVG